MIIITPLAIGVNEKGLSLAEEERPSFLTLRNKLPIQNQIIGLKHKRSGQEKWLLVNTNPLFLKKNRQIDKVVTVFTEVTVWLQFGNEMQKRNKHLKNLSFNRWINRYPKPPIFRGIYT